MARKVLSRAVLVGVAEGIPTVESGVPVMVRDANRNVELRSLSGIPEGEEGVGAEEVINPFDGIYRDNSSLLEVTVDRRNYYVLLCLVVLDP